MNLSHATMNTIQAALAATRKRAALTQRILVRYDESTAAKIESIRKRTPDHSKSGVVRAAILIGLDMLDRELAKREVRHGSR